MDAVKLLEDIQDSLDYVTDRFAVQKLQNVIHYLTAPREYTACHEFWGSLEI